MKLTLWIMIFLMSMLVGNTQHELMCLIGNGVKTSNLDRIRRNWCFGVSGDKTADEHHYSMFSIVHRMVDVCLEVDEVFSGFCVLGDNNSKTIANLMLVNICVFLSPISTVHDFFKLSLHRIKR